jgi:hypothetical protein
MRKRMQLVALGLFLCPLSPVWAQHADDGAVLRAAGSFIRDSLPKEAILVDNEMFRSRPAITASEADDVARAIGAARGRFGDVIQCVAATGTRKKVCTSHEKKTVIAFARPVVGADAAKVEVYWVYSADSQLVGRTVTLALIRRANGEWQVRSMRETGHS